MKKIIFNDDEQKDIIKMYLDFTPINQIREKYGVSKKRIYDVLKDNNIDLHGEKTKFSSVEETRIIQEYLNNKSASCLSKENHVTTDTILKLLRRNNITIRSREESLFQYLNNPIGIEPTPAVLPLIGKESTYLLHSSKYFIFSEV